MENTIEWENNRIGRRSTDLFKKIRDIKGKFHARMGIIKNRNGNALREAEVIKKRWQESMSDIGCSLLGAGAWG